MGKCIPSRQVFDRIYNEHVIGSPFLEVPEYYEIARERYWRSLQILCEIGIDPSLKVVEFGGGQMCLLLKYMFDMDVTVADISEDYRGPIDAAGLQFVVGNVMVDPPVAAGRTFDLVIMLEVIEHIPEPPLATFRRLAKILSPGGRIYLTTPNLFRLRNIARMIRGKDFLDYFMPPMKDVGLGHQMEYSLEHMRWQIEQADLEVQHISHDQLGVSGHSAKARLARKLLSPLTRGRWQEELVAMARLPA